MALQTPLSDDPESADPKPRAENQQAANGPCLSDKTLPHFPLDNIPKLIMMQL